MSPPTVMYRVFTQVSTGKLFPIEATWDGHHGTPSARFIAQIARDFGIDADDIAATDSDTPPDFSDPTTVVARPGPVTPTDSDALAAVKAALTAVQGDGTVPATVTTWAGAVLTLLEQMGAR